MGVYTNTENYLKALCIAHPDVAHGTVVAGRSRNSFFRINNEEELTEATGNNIDYPCVAYMSVTGRIKDIENAMVDIRHAFHNEWQFLQHVNSKVDQNGIGNADRIQAAFDITFSIMEDFIKAMKDDYETNNRCGAFENFDLNKINYVQCGPTQENEYGWILYFDSEVKATRVIDGSDGGGGGLPPINPYRNDPEIIWILDENTKTVAWTPERKSFYGVFPSVEVWLRGQDGVFNLSEIQPFIDAPPPNFTTMYFEFSGLEYGFIVIK